MADEIERKFWVKSFDFLRHHPLSMESIRQGYLAITEMSTTRIRIYGSYRAEICVKGKTVGIRRPEFEYDIPVDEAEDMLELCPSIIEKQRYTMRTFPGFPIETTKIEVDCFEGANANLVIAEIELNHEDQKYPIPEWLGEEIDPKSDMFKMVSNVSLSRNPYMFWTPANIARIKFPKK